VRAELPLEEVLRLYTTHLSNSPDLMAGLGDLVGKELGCWCKPKPCHGDILVKECKRWLASDRIHHVEGSVFEAPEGVALAHCVSADLAMSAGIAVQFVRRWPDIRSGYSRSEPGSLHVHSSSRGYIFNLITKERFDDKPSLEDFRKSIVALKSKMQALNIKTLAMPELGSGRDRLNLSKVIHVLQSILVEAGIGIIMYHLRGREKDEALRKAEIEFEESGDLESNKTGTSEKKVSFNLSKNATKEIVPQAIPGLAPDETKLSKKKRKKKKKELAQTASYHLDPEPTKTPSYDMLSDNLGERLRKLNKQLVKLELGEERLESVGEAEIGKHERQLRRKELKQEVETLQLRLQSFN